jgi:hypothetical protein
VKQFHKQFPDFIKNTKSFARLVSIIMMRRITR